MSIIKRENYVAYKLAVQITLGSLCIFTKKAGGEILKNHMFTNKGAGWSQLFNSWYARYM